MIDISRPLATSRYLETVRGINRRHQRMWRRVSGEYRYNSKPWRQFLDGTLAAMDVGIATLDRMDDDIYAFDKALGR